MTPITSLYRRPLALLTDLYQVTMAYAYWKRGVHDREAVFHLFFRQNPFQGGFTVACGLRTIVDLLETARFTAEDTDYLADLRGNDGAPLFEPEFLSYLRRLRFSCDLDAAPDGSVVFPHEPVLRIQGPILQCQLLETPLLNAANFESLIATKAARVCLAAEGDRVIEFGLRRAPGIDGGVTASRAAYIGGCAGTSNLLAGCLFGVPTMGTHAHSWVMFFDDDFAAFDAYADALPNNCVFVVDTYNTQDGVRQAIEVGRRLRDEGHRLAGIRLDSGDIAFLSTRARAALDEAGFHDVIIVASNDLDEHTIASLKSQRARVDVWGVGTRLVTCYGQGSLGGVLKLTAVRDESGAWRERLKLSEQAVKVSTPGILQTRRFRSEEGLDVADAVYDVRRPVRGACTIVDPFDPTRQRRINHWATYRDVLIPVFRGGSRVYDLPALAASRENTASNLKRLHPGILRLLNPHEYPVGLEASLHERRIELMGQYRRKSQT